jgi:hypothetical protein
MSHHHAPGSRAALTALLFLACSSVVACGSSEDTADIARLTAGQQLTHASADGHAVVHVDVVGGALVEGKNAFSVWFEPETTELTGASALMPVHGHGIDRTPTIEKTGEGYRVGELVFYMSGLWNVHLDLNVDSHADHLEFSIDVP